MNVKELKAKIEDLDDNLEIFLMQTDDESAYNLVNTVEVRTITFSAEDIPRKQWAKDKVLAITDEY